MRSDWSVSAMLAYGLVIAVLSAGGFFLFRRRTKKIPQQEKTVQNITLHSASVSELESEAVLAGEAMPSATASEDEQVLPDFGEQLRQEQIKRGLDVEVASLQKEVQQLRSAVTQLTTEVRQLTVVHNVSPAYAEAVALAQQGLSAADIAVRCGISLGEAELVSALSQSDSA